MKRRMKPKINRSITEIYFRQLIGNPIKLFSKNQLSIMGPTRKLGFLDLRILRRFNDPIVPSLRTKKSEVQLYLKNRTTFCLEDKCIRHPSGICLLTQDRRTLNLLADLGLSTRMFDWRFWFTDFSRKKIYICSIPLDIILTFQIFNIGDDFRFIIFEFSLTWTYGI